ncbi:hypothetical protein Tco_1111297 [Tanacetum coccineum]|uniref:Reverse transcriptase zinc-binding domain-containing protein n=1 Tax=Tanacetum coccineum TaxID=301880 RepID=A0ABQ5INW8_9ASTR
MTGGWKCLLKLRDWVGTHMRYRIRDGKSISVWHDKWNSETSLSSIISKKEIFYDGFNDFDKISDIMGCNRWKWPPEWIIKYPWLKDINVSNLSNSSDRAVWVDNKGLFGIQTAFPNTPLSYGLQQRKGYVLKTGWQNEVWKKVCNMAKIQFVIDTWENTLDQISKFKNDKSVWTVIKKICFAAAVYYIWQERNMRLFDNHKREAKDLTDILSEEVKARLMSITVKDSESVIQAENAWNVIFEKKN